MNRAHCVRGELYMQERTSVVEKFLFARKEAAFSLGLSIRSIDYLIAKEELATRRIGKKVLVTRESLRLFARGNHPEALNSEPEGLVN
jgi:hypothetical protein